MESFLRVTNWPEYYETSETQKLKSLKWVPVRNNHSDPGYLMIVSQENGAALFGAWVAILQLASRTEKKRRGDLVEGNGRPYTIDSIALVVRMPVELIQRAVVLLASPQVGWLEWVGDPPAEVPGKSPAVAGESQRRIEQEGELNQNCDHREVCSSSENLTSAFLEGPARDVRKISDVVKPRKAADRELIAKAVALKDAGLISENALWDAVEAVNRVNGVKNAVGYFRTALSNGVGPTFDALLSLAKPPDGWQAAFARPADPRLVEK